MVATRVDGIVRIGLGLLVVRVGVRSRSRVRVW